MTGLQQSETPAFEMWLNQALTEMYRDVMQEEVPDEMLDILQGQSKPH